MTTRTRWIVGLLLALVVGLAVGLAIVAGDDSDQPATITVEPTTEETTSTEATTTETTETTPTSDNGGIPGPQPSGGTGGSGL